MVAVMSSAGVRSVRSSSGPNLVQQDGLRGSGPLVLSAALLRQHREPVLGVDDVWMGECLAGGHRVHRQRESVVTETRPVDRVVEPEERSAAVGGPNTAPAQPTESRSRLDASSNRPVTPRDSAAIVARPSVAGSAPSTRRWLSRLAFTQPRRSPSRSRPCRDRRCSAWRSRTFRPGGPGPALIACRCAGPGSPSGCRDAGQASGSSRCAAVSPGCFLRSPAWRPIAASASWPATPTTAASSAVPAAKASDSTDRRSVAGHDLVTRSTRSSHDAAAPARVSSGSSASTKTTRTIGGTRWDDISGSSGGLFCQDPSILFMAELPPKYSRWFGLSGSLVQQGAALFTGLPATWLAEAGAANTSRSHQQFAQSVSWVVDRRGLFGQRSSDHVERFWVIGATKDLPIFPDYSCREV